MRRLILLLPLLLACANPVDPHEHTAILVQNLTNEPLNVALQDADGTTSGVPLNPFSRGCYAVTFRGALHLIATQVGGIWTLPLPADPGYHLDFDAITNPGQPLTDAPC